MHDAQYGWVGWWGGSASECPTSKQETSAYEKHIAFYVRIVDVQTRTPQQFTSKEETSAYETNHGLLCPHSWRAGQSTFQPWVAVYLRPATIAIQ